MKKQYTEMMTSLRKARKITGLSYVDLEARSKKILATVHGQAKTVLSPEGGTL